MSKPLAACALLLLAGAGAAQPEAERVFMIHGPGATTCSEFLGAVAAEESVEPNLSDDRVASAGLFRSYAAYLAGHLTAANMYHPRVSSGDIAGSSQANVAMYWLKSYCQDNQFELFAGAVDSLIESKLGASTP